MPKIETRNNLLSPQSIHGGNHYPNLGLANMAKGRATRDVNTDESCNEMKKKIERKEGDEKKSANHGIVLEL